LMENECKIMQGYYFSKPLSAEQLTRYIASNNL
jgi:EAL domain-containing protein (putative c-di-GMP-specific phosphodiesterase class I)